MTLNRPLKQLAHHRHPDTEAGQGYIERKVYCRGQRKSTTDITSEKVGQNKGIE